VSRVFAAFLSGLIFGIGLIVSQMSNPAKVIGFLDVTGNWDPSLALVMAGALTVFGAAYWRLRKRSAPLLGPWFPRPGQRNIDGPLVLGSLIFGVGWGLSGFCPGPAVVSTAFGEWRVWLFLAAMVVGMLAFRFRFGKQLLVDQA
jgi:uncharacterized membrane protein YedE/YeeE